MFSRSLSRLLCLIVALATLAPPGLHASVTACGMAAAGREAGESEGDAARGAPGAMGAGSGASCCCAPATSDAPPAASRSPACGCCEVPVGPAPGSDSRPAGGDLLPPTPEAACLEVLAPTVAPVRACPLLAARLVRGGVTVLRAHCVMRD